jgi:hypothetical protein
LKKLSDKFLCPYKIINKVGSHSFTLRLPDTFREVHPIYHISMLELHPPNTIPNHIDDPPPPIEIKGDLKYEVAEILDSKINRQRQCKLLYLVRWLGYEGTADELSHASDLIANYHTTYPDKP